MAEVQATEEEWRGGLEATGPESPAPRVCSIADALSVLGERWTLLVIREMAYGVHRFDHIAGYTGMPRSVLAERLRKLEGRGVIERRQYSQHPSRYEYHLTEPGLQAIPLLVALASWGRSWATGPASGRGPCHRCCCPFDGG